MHVHNRTPLSLVQAQPLPHPLNLLRHPRNERAAATIREPQLRVIIRSEQKHSALATVVGAERSDATSFLIPIPRFANTADNLCSSVHFSFRSQRLDLKRRKPRRRLRSKRRTVAGGRLPQRLIPKKARHAFSAQHPRSISCTHRR